MSRPINRKEKMFCAQYMIDHNGAQAAIRAGYSAKTAKVVAAQLIARPHIKTYLNDLIAKQQERVQITADRVVKELAVIAFCDIRQAFDANGKLINPKDMPEEVARAIASIDTEELFEWDAENKTKEYIGDSKKLKFCDKVRALEALGRHFKMFTDRVEVDISDRLAERLKSARERINTRPGLN